MFRKNGFQVYLVDEFRTSCKYSNCECSKFREIRNPKPAKIILSCLMVFFFVRKIVDYGTEMRIQQGTFTNIFESF